VALTDLVTTKQISIWGRHGNTSAFGYPIDATDEEILAINVEVLKGTYSAENKKLNPLCSLSDQENFNYQYIPHNVKGVDLLSNGFNGAWINRFTGTAHSKYDLHFSKVDMVKALNLQPQQLAS